MCNSMQSECDSSRPESSWSEAESERESGEEREEGGALIMAEPGKHPEMKLTWPEQ